MAPMSFAVRNARPEDYRVFVRLFPELGVNDPVAQPDGWEREMMGMTLICEDEGGQALGYTFFQLIAEMAYVRHLVTAPEARRRGVGRALLEAVLERARAASPSCTSWCLNVKPENRAAVALYESMGLVRRFASKAIRVEWFIVDGRRTLHDASIAVRIIAPEEDARVEPAMNLMRGELATTGRAREGRVVLGLFDGDTPLGAAVFNPHYPGAYPFRAARPELALVLLAAIRPYARPTDEWIQVVCEDQPSVADALLAAGATLVLDIVNMSSTIATAVPTAATR